MDNLRGFFGRVFGRTSSNPDNNLETNPRQRNHEGPEKDLDVEARFRTFNYPNSGFPNMHSDNDSINSFDNSINRPTFIFGDLFSVMGSMFQDMERSMRDMEQFFEGGTFFNRPEFGMLEDNPFSQSPNGSLEDKPGPNSKSRTDGNVRDLILKDDAPISNKDKVDTDLDELYKANKLDINEVLGLLDKDKPKTPSTEVVPVPNKPRNSFQSTSTESNYSFSNGKWVVQERIVKQTPEGKEVTTRTTNENGEIETKTEFFRSSGADPFKSYNYGDENMNTMTSIFEKLFRPRM